MRICLAQLKPLKGEVLNNIQSHLLIIKKAVNLKIDAIFFPELSITGYEPELAKKNATDIENSIFDSFQNSSDLYKITIGIGVPTNSSDGINISLLIFRPNKKRSIYSKQILHSDELPYFKEANQQQKVFHISNIKIAFGICYETLQREHFLAAKKEDANVYIASVAKPNGGIKKAYSYFSKIAKEFTTPILMVNSYGFCDNFMSVGKSAVWSKSGNLIEQLDDDKEGLLIYDTISEKAEAYLLNIELGKKTDSKKLFEIYKNAKKELERNNIFQWTDNYPTLSIIEKDLEKKVLYVLKNKNTIVGAINISEEQEEEYSQINWKFNSLKVLVIHRLVIHPKYQRKGFASFLMDFAEDFAEKNNYTSIRLDAYSPNKNVVDFYKRRNYFIRGNVSFPEREKPFNCMEKKV